MKMKGLSAFLILSAVCLLVPAPLPAAIDATAKIKVLLQRSTFSAASDTTTNTYFLKNASTATLVGPFRVVLESLDNRDVAVLNPDGYTPEGSPYFEYQKASLAPSAKTAGKPWLLYQRCGKKVTAAMKAFDAAWQITPPASCSPLATLHVSVLASEVGANHAPVADAGPDQTVKAGTVIPLDGSLSSDEDGNPLTYRWSVVSKPVGSRVTLTKATTVRPTVKFTLAGTYVLGLTVRDGVLTSARDTCTLTTVNSRPVADAGSDQTVELGPVRLDGDSSTDADGDRLSYSWSIVAMPQGAQPNLSGATSVRPSFTADTAGEYVLQLVVSHGTKRSYPDFCRISTTNSRPRANAGLEQKVSIGASVRLDGAGSSDVDGDALTYRWGILSKPAGSAAALAAPASVRPSFTADVAGTYVAQLTVNDGSGDSVPATVVVTTVNARPVAAAGHDQTASRGARVTLDGSGSLDADGSALTWKWSLLSAPRGSTARLAAATTAAPSFTADRAGSYVVQLAVSDGVLKSHPDTVVVATGNSPPAADAGADQNAYTNSTVNLDGSGSADPDADFLTPLWAMLLKPTGSAAMLSDPMVMAPSFLADLPGTYVLQLTVRDGKYGSVPDTVAITTTVHLVTVPNVVGMAQADAELAITTALLSVGSIAREYDDVVPAASVISQNPSGGVSVPQGSSVAMVVSLGPEPIPPDPGAVAPPLDRTVATTLAAATEFLYTGADPIQRGVAPGTIELQRAAVIRGKVSTRDGLPLPGVKITILGHPEFGHTLSRLDGMFDLAVNGGGYLTVNYAKKGYLTGQRQVNVPWQDYVFAPDVVMIGLDSAVTTIDLTAPAMQVAQGSQVTDVDGSRTATLLVPPGTTAQLVLPDGSTQTITTLNVRATEYTVGENGPEAMPAALPPTSGYTYAVELSADEAISSGATAVNFSQPLFFYVEDFIGFPVGSAVPTGYYDRQKGQWIASDNGRVITILGTTGGLADVDTDGDGYADSGLGITDAERQQMAALYSQTPKQLWRVPMTHFTPWDCNWPYGPPEDAVPPSQTPSTTQEEDESCESGGSIIDCQNQALGERLPVAGTPFALNYRSDRSFRYSASSTMKVPLIGGSVPASLTGIVLEITIAGRSFTQTFAPGPDQTATFIWDGLDVYGRPLQGGQMVSIDIGYAYRPQYYPVRADFERSFARSFPGSQGVRARDRSSITLWQHSKVAMNLWDAQGLGGWSLDVHHVYDPVGKTLYLGSGERRSAVNRALVMDTVAGNGLECDWGDTCGDGGPAVDAPVWYNYGVSLAPDGSIYIPDRNAGRIRKVDPDGIITSLAGSKEWCTSGTDPCGDGGPALEAKLGEFWSVVPGPDGSIYYADLELYRVRKVSPDGIITTVAGTGVRGFSGDGGAATQARLDFPSHLALGPDGSLYISDQNRIRRVGTDGYITTVAGNGVNCGNYSTNPCGDGGPATEASLYTEGLAISADGTIYFGSFSRVRKVTPDGIMRPVAGTGEYGYAGDGGPAAAAKFGHIKGVALTSYGALLVADGDRNMPRIRRIGPDGIVRTIAGTGVRGFSGDGGPAAAAQMSWPYGIAVGPDGSTYVADLTNQRIRRLRPSMPAFSGDEIVISGEDGRELYVFNGAGRHLKTVSALTGATLHEFAYDPQGRLIRITDGDNNATSVERDTSGNPVAVVGPYGARTTFALDAGGYLAGVTNPAGETTAFEYATQGLMTKRTSPRGFSSIFTYDAAGRLIKDEDAVGGYQALARTESGGSHEVTRTTALGRTTTYRVENLPTGDKLSANTFPDGSRSTSLAKADGSQTITEPDGTVTTVQQGPDPRFGMQSPIISSLTLQTPGGLQYASTGERTVSLFDDNNPLSLAFQTDTIKVNNRTFQRKYIASTREVILTTPEGRTAVSAVDSQGRLTRRELLGLEPFSYSYDSRGRLVTKTQGIGTSARQATIRYDESGQIAEITDPMGRTLSLAYDAAGRMTRKTLPDGSRVSYGYDAGGNLALITPPGRPGHTYSFTPVDDTREYVPPEVGAGSTKTVYAYNLDRQLVLVTRPDGQQVALDYDSGGRLAGVTTARGTTSYSYQPLSNNISVIATPDGASLSYAWDGPLLTGLEWRGEVNGAVGFAYDEDFRIAAQTVNGGSGIALAYDQDGLLVQAGGLAITRYAQTGVIAGSTIGSISDVVAFNTFGELVDYRAAFDASEFFRVLYARDKIGRVIAKTEAIGAQTDSYAYGYDAAGRLTEVSKNGNIVMVCAYDGNGNRVGANLGGVSVSATYDAQDRLLEYGSTTFSYGANGELQSRTAGPATTTYDYDELGNLRSVTLAGDKRIDYLIDGQNRRIGRKVDGVLMQAFLYNGGSSPVAELDGAGNVVTRFVYGTRRKVPDYLTRGGNTYRIILDHLGSVRLVVDAATGEAAQRMDYDAFGSVILDTNPGFQPFGFAGGLYDVDTKLTRFGARDYDAETGRWTAKDPIRFSGRDTNLYGYVLNDPVNLTDPTGLLAECFMDVEGEKFYPTRADCEAMCKDKKWRENVRRSKACLRQGPNRPTADPQCVDDCFFDSGPWEVIDTTSFSDCLSEWWGKISEPIRNEDHFYEERPNMAVGIRG